MVPEGGGSGVGGDSGGRSGMDYRVQCSACSEDGRGSRLLCAWPLEAGQVGAVVLESGQGPSGLIATEVVAGYFSCLRVGAALRATIP